MSDKWTLRHCCCCFCSSHCFWWHSGFWLWDLVLGHVNKRLSMCETHADETSLCSELSIVADSLDFLRRYLFERRCAFRLRRSMLVATFYPGDKECPSVCWFNNNYSFRARRLLRHLVSKFVYFHHRHTCITIFDKPPVNGTPHRWEERMTDGRWVWNP